ncbi:MAG: cytochrome c4 [Xanthomonadaceae bacterium]|nr:cytochrome c4 [Xanthomonadaceae bacterium]
MRFRRVLALASVTLVGALLSVAAIAQAAAPAKPARVAQAQAAAPAAAVAPTAAPLKPGDATAGQAKAAVCGACHGLDGNSSDPQYPKLAGQQAGYIVRQLELFKSGQRPNPIMLGMATPLSPQDMADVAAYFAKQKTLPGIADKTLVSAGGKLYREGDKTAGIPACMACHGPDGRGNPGALYPHLAGQHAQYVQQVLTAWHSGQPWGKGPHAQIMLTIAGRLSTADIAAVASYIQGLHTAVPAAAPASAVAAAQ